MDHLIDAQSLHPSIYQCGTWCFDFNMVIISGWLQSRKLPPTQQCLITLDFSLPSEKLTVFCTLHGIEMISLSLQLKYSLTSAQNHGKDNAKFLWNSKMVWKLPYFFYEAAFHFQNVNEDLLHPERIKLSEIHFCE